MRIKRTKTPEVIIKRIHKASREAVARLKEGKSYLLCGIDQTTLKKVPMRNDCYVSTLLEICEITGLQPNDLLYDQMPLDPDEEATNEEIILAVIRLLRRLLARE